MIVRKKTGLPRSHRNFFLPIRSSMLQLHRPPPAAPKTVAFRHKPGVPIGSIPTRLNGYLDLDGALELTTITLQDNVPKNPNFTRMVMKALVDAQDTNVALPGKLDKFARRTDNLIRDFRASSRSEGTWHRNNRSALHSLENEIRSLIKDLKDKRDFFFQVVKDEAGLTDKDQAVADILVTGALFAAHFRDALVVATSRMQASLKFIATHKKELAKIDAEELQQAWADGQHVTPPERGRDATGADVTYVVDDAGSEVNGTRSACAFLLLLSAKCA